MKRFIRFSKFSALGNDFIVINDRDGNLANLFQKNNIKNLCEEHFGIGADGLILIESDHESSFRMIYHNSDGIEAPMCGNGARVSAAFAYKEHIANSKGQFRAYDGLHSYAINGESILVSLNVKTEGIKFDLPYDDKKISFINTGVPHAVLIVKDTETFPVEKIGRAIRTNSLFAPKGTNVDFVQPIDEHTLKIRTYERGVESETYSCGTGATAAAIIMTLKSFTKPPINVINKLNKILKVDFTMNNGRIANVTLEGEVKEVAKGNFNFYDY